MLVGVAMDAHAMTTLSLTEPELIRHIFGMSAALGAGILIGMLHFLTLRWNAAMFAAGQSLLPALAMQLARFAATTGALAVVAGRFGALPLLVAAAGVLATRTVVVRRGARP